MPTVRCVVPSRAQPGLDVDRRITRAVATHAQRYLGVYARAAQDGTLRVADAAEITPPTISRPRQLLTKSALTTKRLLPQLGWIAS